MDHIAVCVTASCAGARLGRVTRVVCTPQVRPQVRTFAMVRRNHTMSSEYHLARTAQSYAPVAILDLAYRV